MGGRSGSRTAAHTLIALDAVGTRFAVSSAQARLIEKAGRDGGRFVYGREVVSAQKLASLKLGVLEDNGSLGQGGNTDGERWFFKLVEGVRMEGLRVIQGGAK